METTINQPVEVKQRYRKGTIEKYFRYLKIWHALSSGGKEVENKTLVSVCREIKVSNAIIHFARLLGYAKNNNLIVEPTKEMAIKINEDFKSYQREHVQKRKAELKIKKHVAEINDAPDLFREPEPAININKVVLKELQEINNGLQEINKTLIQILTLWR